VKAFIAAALSLTLLVLCASAEAQQGKRLPRIGFLASGSRSYHKEVVEAFRQGLRDLGYIEGKNIVIEYRYAEGETDRFPKLVAELLQLQVNVLVVTGTAATQAAKNATNTIPIVGTGTDLVGTGLIDSLAHPGGNVTGLSNLNDAVGGKQLELIKEAFPRVFRVAALWAPSYPGNTIWIGKMKTAAQELQITLQLLEVQSAGDFDAAFSAIKREHAGALGVLQNGVNGMNVARIFHFTTKSKLPAIYPDSSFVDAGGLMSYGSSRIDLDRRAAYYVDKILKGAKPADLPVEQPTKFELVINLKTAKQIGLTIPPNVLARADRVIK
jgi:putative ABC transport system substrate-binding protein